MGAEELRLTLEVGPKGKKVVAVAPDWPGLERGAKSEDAAVERVLGYVPRYAGVAGLAGMESEFLGVNAASVVERYPGNGSTDFWGISFTFSTFDQEPMSNDELERDLALMRACWAYFDEVRLKVSAEMRKGPRGGGRDRDRIVRHTIVAEHDMAKKVGIRIPSGVEITEDGLTAYRDDYCRTIRAFHAEGKMARSWPLRYLIRHTAFHTLDHTWEMEDKDLTADGARD